MEQGEKNADLCREAGVSQGTMYQWKSKYSGMEVSQLKKLKEMEMSCSTSGQPRDGLQDQIFFSSDSVPYIKVNTGTKYVTYSKDDFGYNLQVFSQSFSAGLSGNMTKTFPLKSIPSQWPLLEWRQSVTLGLNMSTGMQC